MRCKFKPILKWHQRIPLTEKNRNSTKRKTHLENCFESAQQKAKILRSNERKIQIDRQGDLPQYEMKGRKNLFHK